MNLAVELLTSRVAVLIIAGTLPASNAAYDARAFWHFDNHVHRLGQVSPVASCRFPMTPTLSQVCSLNSPFAKDVEDYAAGGCASMEVWLTKLEEHLKTHTIDDTRRLLEKCEMAVPVASFQGGLLVSQGEERNAHWGHFTRRLELCQHLNISTLVVACDITERMTQELLDRASASLAQAADLAADSNVRIAFEFQRQATFGNNLQSAAMIIAEANSPLVGVCLDTFHFFHGPSKLFDLGYANADNLFHVQVSDIAGIPRELAIDSDRILPGDGDLPLQPIIDHLRQIEYQGAVSVELMNPNIWQVPALQFGEIGMTALQRLLSQ